ncbi:HPP family protein [Williamsia sp.]|uniref:HPP family protein n=1 Tax=Williamsia sp. TaxID=1872085 RepID=UPI002F92127A
MRSLGPATAPGQPREFLRAGAGVVVGLGLVGVLFLLMPGESSELGLYLIAPFGATAVLVFAAPSSPLAQPWPAIVGNTLAAVVGVAVTLMVSDTTLRIALAVGLAVAAMILARAVHPPAGAVAMTAALSPDVVDALGFRFALAPVAIGTVLLVIVAALYGRATGRHYPFRQFDAATPPAQRLGLSEDELAGILQHYRQTLNLGVADLARLIGAAEMQAATHRAGPLKADDVMSRDLVTVAPEATLDDVAELFRLHGFTSLPVVGDRGRFLGIVYQIHLIVRLQDPEARGGFGKPTLRWADRRGEVLRARDLMAVDPTIAAPSTPVAALLPELSQNGGEAVPVLDGTILVGILTQTDLIAALARQTLNLDPT